MEVGDDAVGAPEEDQPRIDDIFRVEADARADRRPIAHCTRAGTDRPVELCRAETVKEAAVHRPITQQTGVAGVAVRNDRLGATFSGDAAQALGNGGQCLFPGDALEACAGTLGADPAQRVQQAVGMINALGVEGDLGAQHPCRRGMIGRAGDLEHATIADGYFECAGVGAIVWANAAHPVRGCRFGGGFDHSALSV
jgi:hypothetical protein